MISANAIFKSTIGSVEEISSCINGLKLLQSQLAWFKISEVSGT